MGSVKVRGRPKQDPEPRRREILSAAIRVFAKSGYRNTEVQRVADMAGLAKGTVYLYFETKEALFLAAVTYAVERLAERIDAEVRSASGAVAKIKAVVRAYFRFFDEDRALVDVLVQERGEVNGRAEQAYYRVFSENAWRLEKIIRDGVATGVFRRLKPRRTANILANLLTGTIYAHVVGRRGGRASAEAGDVTDFLLYGLLMPRKEK